MFNLSTKTVNQTYRLRVLMLIFFVAMAAPTIVLVSKSFEQLQWEAYYQHREIAEDLAQRIDQELATLLEKEDQRPFSEYAFLLDEGKLQIGASLFEKPIESSNVSRPFFRRSPISNYPLNDDFPGLVGYFQVDPDGRFSTPFLPDSTSPNPNESELNDLASQYGMSVSDLSSRKELESTLIRILSSNNLLTAKATESKPRQLDKDDLTGNLYSQSNRRSSSGSFDRLESAVSSSSRRSKVQPTNLEKTHPAESYKPELESKAQNIEKERVSQAAFDQLSRQNSVTKISKKKITVKGDDLLNVAELELKSPYQSKIRERVASAKKPASAAQSSVNKKGSKRLAVKRQSGQALNDDLADSAIDINLNNSPIPSAALVAAQANAATISPANESLVAPSIEIFQNEIDPIELTLLESGHWVLFRKVWRNGQRYIQGLLVEQSPFLTAVFEQKYRDSLVSSMSHLAVVYQGNVLSAYGRSSRRDLLSSEQGLNGTLLYRSKMSAPFNNLEGLYTIKNLPAGAGSSVIWWATCVLLIVLLLGTYVLYRLSLRNLNLAAQQQDFVSAVSHELKTPLTSIRMYGEILKSGWADDAKKESYYSFIFDESERLTRLINNVLALARMTRNETKPNFQLISITELFDVIRSKVDSQVSAAGFVLNLSFSEEVGRSKLTLDQDLFTQVMINLVDNALKFSSNTSRKEIAVSAQVLTANQVEISVRDYGPGIEKNQMKKIFQLFYRTESELTRETSGTGIGLALVNQLTRLMNGKVDVINHKEGAEFKLCFNALNKVD